MVIKILELGILTELTEEEKESCKGGTGETVPVVPKAEDAGEPPTDHVIPLLPTPIVVETAIVAKTPIVVETAIVAKTPTVVETT